MRFVWLAAGLFLLMSSHLRAQGNDEPLIKAQEAYNKQDLLRLQAYTRQMQAQKDILAPYADYWRMLLELSTADDQAVRDFIDQYADFPFADRVRGEWLKQLGKRQDWQAFFVELPNLQRDDTAVSCYGLQGQSQLGQAIHADKLQALWLVSADQPANCTLLFDAMFRAGILTQEHAWARFRLAMQAGKISVAKAVSQYISAIDASNIKLIDRAYQNPQQVLQKQSISYKSRYGRELNLYALDRVARTQPPLALEIWQKNQSQFNAEERSYMWGRLALHAARRHDPIAGKWFGMARDTQLDNEQMAWRARTALRTEDWPAVISAIEAMPATEQETAAWRYWKARALKAQKQIPAANALFVPLSREHHYYGLLAEEELGEIVAAPASVYKANEAELKLVSAKPAIQRALALNDLGLRWEARAEWAWALRDFDDKQLIAAAEIAFRNDWIDVAINTAEKTRLTHDFALRYPTPYRDMMQAYVKENGLDEAWVYGLIRQESRFIGVARSSAGASGLMQVMPATAKWIAKRLGMAGYNPGMITQLDTNIQFGTHYLRYTLDQMDGQALMATAAYNAGPSRPKRWAASQPLEGPIYADTIPFTETRDYVKKVMANAYYYAQQMGHHTQSLKERLGIVPGNAISVTVTEEAE
ncbi:soluble lytic murein transglycosylase [Methylophilaceae bacterium]|nr:soluble lytic murein transglycosylase [Methylophilaceae bacterium]